MARTSTSLIYITHIAVEFKTHNCITVGKLMKLQAEEEEEVKNPMEKSHTDKQQNITQETGLIE